MGIVVEGTELGALNEIRGYDSEIYVSDVAQPPEGVVSPVFD